MNDKLYRGVYGCFVDDVLLYVGSTVLGLEKLAYNHRNWKQLGYDWTNFRQHLVEDPNMVNNEFRWLIKPALRTQREVEELEGQLIRNLKPPLNVDKDPVASSIKYGRYS